MPSDEASGRPTGRSKYDDDEDLDRYVAELLAKEAREGKDVSNIGTSSIAFGSNSGPSKVPATKKRFLASVLRNVDQHNAHVIASLAKEAARGQEERERQQIRRAESSSSSTSTRRESKAGPSRLRGWEDDEPDQNGSRSRPSKEGHDRRSSSHRHRHSPDRSVNDRRRKRDDRDHDIDSRSNSKTRRRRRSRDDASPSPPPLGKGSSSRSGPSSDARAIPAPSSPPSKMSRIFQASYDPTLDINPDYSTDPKTGLIGDGGWNSMQMKSTSSSSSKKRDDDDDKEKRKKEEKLERKRQRDEIREVRRQRRRKADDESEDDHQRNHQSDNIKVGKTALDTTYQKRGTREWDLGK